MSRKNASIAISFLLNNVLITCLCPAVWWVFGGGTNTFYTVFTILCFKWAIIEDWVLFFKSYFMHNIALRHLKFIRKWPLGHCSYWHNINIFYLYSTTWTYESGIYILKNKNSYFLATYKTRMSGRKVG